MAAVGHLGCPRYRFFIFLNFVYKIAAGGHFGCPKITFDLISGHFRSIHNFNFFSNFWQNGCRRPFWMSEIHFRSHFYPFQIDMQLFFFFGNFDKMADVGHFGCPNFTFDRISGHFRSICNFNFFWNFWQNGWRRPFWMSEIHFRSHFWPFQIDRPFWISEIHFRSQFWPFQIDTNFFLAAILDVWKSLWIAFLAISDWSAILDVRNSLSMAFLVISDPYRTFFFNFWQNGHWRPFWMSANNFRSHFWTFQIDTQLFFWNFLTKWPPAPILDGTTMSIIELVRYIWMSNACVKFEECSLNPSKIIALTKLWRGGGGPRGGCVADENIIFPKTYVSREYNDGVGLQGADSNMLI